MYNFVDQYRFILMFVYFFSSSDDGFLPLLPIMSFLIITAGLRHG